MEDCWVTRFDETDLPFFLPVSKNLPLTQDLFSLWSFWIFLVSTSIFYLMFLKDWFYYALWLRYFDCIGIITIRTELLFTSFLLSLPSLLWFNIVYVIKWELLNYFLLYNLVFIILNSWLLIVLLLLKGENCKDSKLCLFF